MSLNLIRGSLVFFLQDKKWILNHEDVALGELLGKVAYFP